MAEYMMYNHVWESNIDMSCTYYNREKTHESIIVSIKEINNNYFAEMTDKAVVHTTKCYISTDVHMQIRKLMKDEVFNALSNYVQLTSVILPHELLKTLRDVVITHDDKSVLLKAMILNRYDDLVEVCMYDEQKVVSIPIENVYIGKSELEDKDCALMQLDNKLSCLIAEDALLSQNSMQLGRSYKLYDKYAKELDIVDALIELNRATGETKTLFVTADKSAIRQVFVTRTTFLHLQDVYEDMSRWNLPIGVVHNLNNETAILGGAVYMLTIDLFTVIRSINSNTLVLSPVYPATQIGHERLRRVLRWYKHCEYNKCEQIEEVMK